MSDYDELAVEIVCVERVPMKLRQADRIEAVRRLSAKGVHSGQIARLVMTEVTNVRRIQRDNDIDPAPPEWAWRRPLTDQQRARAKVRQKAYRQRQQVGSA